MNRTWTIEPLPSGAAIRQGHTQQRREYTLRECQGGWRLWVEAFGVRNQPLWWVAGVPTADRAWLTGALKTLVDMDAEELNATRH